MRLPASLKLFSRMKKPPLPAYYKSIMPKEPTLPPHEQPWAAIHLEGLFARAFASRGVGGLLLEAYQNGRSSWLKPGKGSSGSSWLLLDDMEFRGATLVTASRATRGKVTTAAECAHACEQSDLGWCAACCAPTRTYFPTLGHFASDSIARISATLPVYAA